MKIKKGHRCAPKLKTNPKIILLTNNYSLNLFASHILLDTRPPSFLPPLFTQRRNCSWISHVARPALDVLLQRGLGEVRRPAVIDKIQYRVELSLAATYAAHTVGDGLKFYEVFLQELLCLILGDTVALFYASRVAVADSPHASCVLVGRQDAALKSLDGLDSLLAFIGPPVLWVLRLPSPLAVWLS